MKHPYESMPRRAFWRSAVSEVSPLEFDSVYTPKFSVLEKTAVAAAGSCFAQHIARQFKRRGFNFIQMESPPPFLSAEQHESFGFELYSARYGNIYSIRQLLQLFQRAAGEFTSSEEIWETDGRFYDPFRPSIEPNGFATREELLRDRDYHLDRVDKLLPKTQLFVFTFGLTEAWLCRADGTVLPTCPGTVAGTFDDRRYMFHNFDYAEVLEDARCFIEFALDRNPEMRFLFTVSPVPLTATASQMHVLQASVYSKSVLRAVCGTLYERYPQVDYFPSYELVASHPMRGMFFQPNLRSVSPVGVDHVLRIFFSAHGYDDSRPAGNAVSGSSEDETESKTDDLICDEELLENSIP